MELEWHIKSRELETNLLMVHCLEFTIYEYYRLTLGNAIFFFYLEALRISDLKGRGFPFPPLGNMDSLKTLIKSNCQMRDAKELLNTRRNSSINWGHEEIEDSVSSTKIGLY
ncbi:hypothetical protein SCA6_013803 [Theobroma cacao]